VRLERTRTGTVRTCCRDRSSLYPKKPSRASGMSRPESGVSVVSGLLRAGACDIGKAQGNRVFYAVKM
jgi:hypothetical protein